MFFSPQNAARDSDSGRPRYKKPSNCHHHLTIHPFYVVFLKSPPEAKSQSKQSSLTRCNDMQAEHLVP